MRIIFTGGGSGGHFYPLIAVARSLRDMADSQKILNLDMIYASDEPYDAKVLQEESIRFLKVPAGKIRRYFSVKNLFDPFKIFFGVIKAIWILYLNYPDVIFAKGGYASFPTLYAAKLLKVPVIIHETDSIPGKVTLWASKFAKKVAISFPEAAKFFPKEKTALIGNPVRREVTMGNIDEAIQLFSLETNFPVVLVLGGSQGAQKLNQLTIDVLAELLSFSQVIHQAGPKNIEAARMRANLVLEKNPHKSRHHMEAFLDEEKMRSAYKAANIVIARAGGGSIFEIAAWGVPAILVPLPTSAQDHQRENAYAYARAGACEVLEEENLTQHILLDRIKKLLSDEQRRIDMSVAAKKFAKPEAAQHIAEEIVRITTQHSS